MIDEGELRSRYPQIPWDQPVKLVVVGHTSVWACRYCIALHGIRAQDVLAGGALADSRKEALDHIERRHHD